MKTKTISKKLLVLLLALVMVLGMLPMAALAEESVPISSVSLDGSSMLPNLVAGGKPSGLVIPEDAPYEIVKVSNPFDSDPAEIEAQLWLEDVYPPQPVSSFEAGYFYIYELALKPKDGNSFAPDATLEVTDIPWDFAENGVQLTKSYVETNKDLETFGCLIFAGGYTVPYTVEIPIEKIVEGEDAPDTMFWIENRYLIDNSYLGIDDSKTTITGNTIETKGESDTPYTGTFTLSTADAEKWEKIKEEGFYLMENSLLPGGWTCGGEVYHIEIKDNGKIKISLSQQVDGQWKDKNTVQAAAFTNFFNKEDAKTETLEIPFTKVVLGEGAPAMTFEFETRECNGVYITLPQILQPVVTGAEIKTAETTEGKTEFGGIIKIEGTKEQLDHVREGVAIREVIPEDEDTGDWTYSTESYYVTFDEKDALKIVTNDFDKDYYGSRGEEVDEIVFTNVYGEEQQPFDSYEITIPISKTVDVAEGVDAAPESATFEFEIFLPKQTLPEGAIAYEDNSITLSGAETETQFMTVTVQTAQAADMLADGFYVKEKTDENDAAWDYSQKIYHVVPSLTSMNWLIYETNENGEDSDYDLDYASFTNTYNGEQEGDPETRFVTFEVVNGTWSDGTTDNIEYTIPVGQYLTTADIPTGMLPNSGFGNGSWNVTPDTTTPITDNVTYTYSFEESKPIDDEPEPVVHTIEVTKEIVGEGAPEDAEFTFELSDGEASTRITITGAGKKSFEPLIFTDNGTYTFFVSELDGGLDEWEYDKSEIKVEIEIVANEDEDGNPLLELGEVIYTEGNDIADGAIFTNTYIGDEEGDEPTHPIKFKIVNGTWIDGTSADIEVLVADGEKLLAGDVPTGMLPAPGYTGGVWDVTPDIITPVTEAKTYTYAFVPDKGDDQPGDQPSDPNVPKTGDNSHIGLWLALALASLGILGGIIVYEKKFRRASKRSR